MAHSIDPFGALTELSLDEGTAHVYSLRRLAAQGVVELDRLPLLHPGAARERGPPRGQGLRQRRGCADRGRMEPNERGRRVPVHAVARRATGLHGRARRGRPGIDARRDSSHGWQGEPDQPGRAGRPRDRSLGAGRLLRHGGRLPAERRARDGAQTGSGISSSNGRRAHSRTSRSSPQARGSCIK